MHDFAAIYSRYSGEIFRFAYGLTLNRAEAEDIAAETFARALTAYDPARQPTVRAFLYTIAHRLVTDYYRRNTRVATVDPDTLASDTAFDKLSEQHDLLSAALNYLKTFPQVDREAVLMRVQGLSYVEIASALEITVATAKVKVHRARLKLALWKSENT